MARISGFPEFLPAGRMVEQQAIDTLQEVFQLHGFANIETRAVEPISILSRKGEITKEVYAIKRLHAEASEPAELGLHFDLTVPLARYVVENSRSLNFPFRRYQIQKVWRGERPQEGRYREFYQADIDIVGDGELAQHYDLEAALVMLDAFAALSERLGLGKLVMHINNRKLSEGFYRGLGIEDPMAVLQIVDKYDKIGAEKVHQLLIEQLGLSANQADQAVSLAGICTADDSFVDQVRALGVSHELLDEGLTSLAQLINAANDYVVPGSIVVDLKIARGLDYYTGTVYETFLTDHPELGSVCSGGRYDTLASAGKRSYPGVGISIGLSRLLAPMINSGELTADRQVPSCVLVALDNDESRPVAMQVANALRSRGIACEVAPTAAKYGKQIRYADRRQIPYVWFGGMTGEVKDIRSGEQQPAAADSWLPPSSLKPSIARKEN